MAQKLRSDGWTVLLPRSAEEMDEDLARSENYDKVAQKRKVNAFKTHFDKIQKAKLS